jgi:Bacterial SH3 domain
MEDRMRTLVLVALLLFSSVSFAAELIVTAQDARLYRFQDNESPAIATLAKGDKLQVVALGTTWFMVRTSSGVTGWIQAKDATGDTSAFRDSGSVQPDKPMP